MTTPYESVECDGEIQLRWSGYGPVGHLSKFELHQSLSPVTLIVRNVLRLLYRSSSFACDIGEILELLLVALYKRTALRTRFWRLVVYCKCYISYRIIRMVTLQCSIALNEKISPIIGFHTVGYNAEPRDRSPRRFV